MHYGRLQQELVSSEVTLLPLVRVSLGRHLQNAFMGYTLTDDPFLE